MKLTVLGASGGIGRLLVTQALARGHAVTAVARGSSSLPAFEGAEVRRGDLTDEGFLRDALRGRDAVLSGLGLRLAGLAPWQRPEQPDFLRASTEALVRAMRAEGVRKVVAVSSGGVGDSKALMPGAFKVFVALTAMRRVFVELEAMEQRYFESGLEVCVVRPSGLTDEPATGRVVVPSRYVGRATIPRADVAAYMLAQVEAPRFDARAPAITVTGAA